MRVEVQQRFIVSCSSITVVEIRRRKNNLSKIRLFFSNANWLWRLQFGRNSKHLEPVPQATHERQTHTKPYHRAIIIVKNAVISIKDECLFVICGFEKNWKRKK